jgi:predicted permease
MRKFLRDLRYGVRTLSRSPGFALTAILVMALGIGASTSLFTIVRAVVLKPLPFRDPDQLVMVYEHFREGSLGDGFNVVSPGDFEDWRRETHGFEDMAAWHDTAMNLTGERGDLPELVGAVGGSWNLFSVLGTPMALGRAFRPEEDQIDGNHVVILTWNMFQRRFGGDPAIIGKQIRLDQKPYEVVGVLPRSFTYPDARIGVWVPYASTFEAKNFTRHDMHQSHVVARVKPGTSADAAAKEVGALQYQLHLAHASQPVAEEVRIRPILDDVVRDVKTSLTMLLCAVACMLLIACLNVSNLLVARSAARRKELAVRGALGGSRMSLLSEQMAECLLICVAGGTLGVMVSTGATQWLASHWKSLPRAESIHVDGVVLCFAVGLVFLTALLAGLLPAWTATGTGILSGLQESSRSVGGSLSRARMRKALLTSEIALTVILLVCAGLLFKSFLHLRTSDLGCDATQVLTMKYSLPRQQYDTPEKIVAFHEGVLERVRRLPGVMGASLVSTPPGGGYQGDDIFTLPEHPATSNQLQYDAMYRSADPEYFRMMRIPLIRGRSFSNQDRLNRAGYMIINKKFADQYFPNEDPIGRQVTVPVKEGTYEIVGVVGDTLWDVSQPVKAMMYFPILTGSLGDDDTATIMVRAAGNPLSLALPVQQQIAALDPSLPVYEILDMQQIVGLSTATQSFSAALVLAFAVLSLALAAIGLYGVLSYLVTQRITEIGIRVALGAQRGEVLRLVLFDGLRPVLLGLAIGVAGGAAAATVIRSLLYGTRPMDASVFVTMAATILVTALLACALPALRAAKIEPMQALRVD